ncbi:MAG TPA: hypothetical protein VGR72_13405 [Candidatus Acidoferrales bacterium]|nr:hypothetical protein [Candidatus Acidoferrales bacterium]
MRAGGIGERVAMLDDGDTGRFDPLAVLGDVSEDAHGAKNCVPGHLGVVHTFEDAFGDAAEIAAAAGEEAGGLSVTIERGNARQIIFAVDLRGAVPVQEIVVDLLAAGMIADGAFAGVALKVSRESGRCAAGGRW